MIRLTFCLKINFITILITDVSNLRGMTHIIVAPNLTPFYDVLTMLFGTSKVANSICHEHLSTHSSNLFPSQLFLNKSHPPNPGINIYKFKNKCFDSMS